MVQKRSSQTASRLDDQTILEFHRTRNFIKIFIRPRLKCDGTRAETRFRLSEKRTSPFKSAWPSVQSTTGSRGVRISGTNAGYTMFRGSVKGTGYRLHSPVFHSIPLPCVNVCHHVSTGLYHSTTSLSQLNPIHILTPAPSYSLISHFHLQGN